MPCQVAVATIRRGDELIHVYKDDLALQLATPLAARAECSGTVDLLREARDAAGLLHEALLLAWPGLGGDAATCFGTALRVKAVRSHLGDFSVRGHPLLKVASWVAAAADAARHLTVPMINDLLAELRRACPAHAVAVPPGPAVEAQGEVQLLVDPLPDYWAGKRLPYKPPPVAEAYNEAWSSWRPSWSQQRRTQRHSPCAWTGGRMSPQAAAWPAFDATRASCAPACCPAPGQWAVDPLQHRDPWARRLPFGHGLRQADYDRELAVGRTVLEARRLREEAMTQQKAGSGLPAVFAELPSDAASAVALLPVASCAAVGQPTPPQRLAACAVLRGLYGRAAARAECKERAAARRYVQRRALLAVPRRQHACAECGREEEWGAFDQQDGMWYCKQCWTDFVDDMDDVDDDGQLPEVLNVVDKAIVEVQGAIRTCTQSMAARRQRLAEAEERHHVYVASLEKGRGAAQGQRDR